MLELIRHQLKDILEVAREDDCVALRSPKVIRRMKIAVKLIDRVLEGDYKTNYEDILWNRKCGFDESKSYRENLGNFKGGIMGILQMDRLNPNDSRRLLKEMRKSERLYQADMDYLAKLFKTQYNNWWCY